MSVPYDTLVLATGARHAYFGHDEWEPFAPGLKTLEDATTIRRRMLLAFERAERETDPQPRAALLTFVIIGGGPTGVELAGTIAELARDTLPRDFRNIDTRKARVVLIEAGRGCSRLSRRSFGLRAARAEAARRRGDAGRAGHGMHRRRRRLRRHELRAHDHLGGGRARLAGREWLGVAADRAGRVRSSPTLPCPAIPRSSRSATP